MSLADFCEAHPELANDLWVLCRVDVDDVWSGKCSAEWVLGFLPRIFVDPWSYTRARIMSGEDVVDSPDPDPGDDESSSGPSYLDWLGYDPVATRLDDLVDMQFTPKGGTPPSRRPKRPTPDDTDADYRRMLRQLGM